MPNPSNPSDVGRGDDRWYQRFSALEEAFLVVMRLRLGLGFGEVEVRAAATAHLVVDRQRLAADGTGPHGSVPLVTRDERPERAEDGQAEAGQEPQEERRALDLPYDPGREAEEEEDDEELHAPGGSEDAQRPDYPDEGEDRHGDPGDRNHEADQDLEQHEAGHEEDPHGKRLASSLRSELTHGSKGSG